MSVGEMTVALMTVGQKSRHHMAQFHNNVARLYKKMWNVARRAKKLPTPVLDSTMIFNFRLENRLNFPGENKKIPDKKIFIRCNVFHE